MYPFHEYEERKPTHLDKIVDLIVSIIDPDTEYKRIIKWHKENEKQKSQEELRKRPIPFVPKVEGNGGSAFINKCKEAEDTKKCKPRLAMGTKGIALTLLLFCFNIQTAKGADYIQQGSWGAGPLGLAGGATDNACLESWHTTGTWEYCYNRNLTIYPDQVREINGGNNAWNGIGFFYSPDKYLQTIGKNVNVISLSVFVQGVNRYFKLKNTGGNVQSTSTIPMGFYVRIYDVTDFYTNTNEGLDTWPTREELDTTTCGDTRSRCMAETFVNEDNIRFQNLPNRNSGIVYFYDKFTIDSKVLITFPAAPILKTERQYLFTFEPNMETDDYWDNTDEYIFAGTRSSSTIPNTSKPYWNTVRTTNQSNSPYHRGHQQQSCEWYDSFWGCKTVSYGEIDPPYWDNSTYMPVTCGTWADGNCTWAYGKNNIWHNLVVSTIEDNDLPTNTTTTDSDFMGLGKIFLDAMMFVFKPDKSIGENISDLTTTMQTRQPFGYIYLFWGTVSQIAPTSTPDDWEPRFNIALASGTTLSVPIVSVKTAKELVGDTAWEQMRTAIEYIMWLMFASYLVFSVWRVVGGKPMSRL